ncbi:Uncharacterised protein [Salmonella enterica subsp. enterica serovar Bovismorbificans]|uniref:Uncharacterized protein n=1 Tax=Salmonella enterica subsp. enterica serovar Bovismorbificans TaxID=58097 RepID=A0A655EDA8_SALET|nr:Uncharacterised protein [Salmonella enterica subsp. enterica serovar Bovismorbificans]
MYITAPTSTSARITHLTALESLPNVALTVPLPLAIRSCEPPAAIASCGKKNISTAAGITARASFSRFRRVSVDRNDFFLTGAEAP